MLKEYQIVTKLCYLSKAFHGAVYSSRLRSFQDSLLLLAFAKTNSCKYFFFPDSIALWDQLPPRVCASSSLRAFKRNSLCALFSYRPLLANCIICLCHLPLLLLFCRGWPRISVLLLPVPCSFSCKIIYI